MADIIHLQKRLQDKQDDLVTAKPWEFRRASWKSIHFVQISRADWHCYKDRTSTPWELPPHFVLKDSLKNTILGVYIYRNNGEKMREVYYLAGLIDCLVNQVNPLLRTEQINEIFKKITLLKNVLDINWYGHIDQVLLPIDNRFYNQQEYCEGLSLCKSLQDLYRLIREGTGRMFDILSSEYLFFTPGEGS